MYHLLQKIVVERLGAATRERDLTGVVAELLGAEHEEQRHAGSGGVAQEQHRRRPEAVRRRIHRLARMAYRKTESIDDRRRGRHRASLQAVHAVEAVPWGR